VAALERVVSVPDGAFAARALAARASYNAVLARALAHGAERDALAEAVREVGRAAEPLAAALAPDAFAATCDALVGAAARLVPAGRWGAGPAGTAERRALLDLVPRLGPWLAVAPAVTVAAVVDGAHAVGGGPGARGDEAAWTERVVAAAHAGDGAVPGDGQVPGDVVRHAVLVAAWRSGLVRYRRAALDAARALPEATAHAALALDHDDDLAAVLDRHAADPWWWPGAAPDGAPAVLLRGVHGPAHVLGRFGGFRGFGGPWLVPPHVVGADPRHPGLRWALRTRSGDAAEHWTLVADVHGSLVARSTPDDVVAHLGPEPFPGPGVPAPPRADDLDDVLGTASVPTPSGRLLLLSRARSYDALLVRWPR